MARKLEMTWQASTRRWFKKHKGKMYTVSCRQLDCPDTKEASAPAANTWWAAKLKEIESAPPSDEDRKANAFKVWSMVQNWGQLSEEDRERLVDSMVGEGQYKQIKAQADVMVAAAVSVTPPDRTVSAQVESWKLLLRSACESKQISTGRYDAYCRRIRPFAEWIGPGSAVDVINEERLEGYFSHLSAQVSSGKYSPSSAHELLMTAKQFISRLATLKLIPLPGNIRDRRFRFNHSAPATIETFTVDEVRALLAACEGFSERTKLYILLMLNCGHYQNDVAELRQDEVDWKAGTVKRARSKTRERGGPVVTYKLWPETFDLLRKSRSSGELVLTTDDGNPLVKEWIEDGKYRKYDAIRSAWFRLAEKMALEKHRLGMKHLRKTSATLLGQHPQFKYYAGYFLADSPKGMDQKHYVVPSQDEFFLALDWLRRQILPKAR
jgi:integrase